MSRRSGWCQGPPGARLRCGECRVPETCACPCHWANPAQPKGNRRAQRVDWGHQKTAPGGALTPESQGLADALGVD